MNPTTSESHTNVEFRPAAPGDAAAIVSIYDQGFPAQLRAMTALGCSGAVAYVESLIAEGSEHTATPFWLAVADDGQPVGFIQWRLQPTVAVLNNIYLLPPAQRQRLGSRLIFASLQATGWSCPTIELDVFAENERAKAWYARLGFQASSERSWRVSDALVTTKTIAAGGHYLIDGLPQADAVHARYGFSQTRVVTPGGDYRIGRLGDDWFRIADPADLADADLLGALAELGPERRMLLIADRVAREGSAVVGDMREIAVSQGMSTSREALLGELRAVCQ